MTRSEDLDPDRPAAASRRAFLGAAGRGLGAAAVGSLLTGSGSARAAQALVGAVQRRLEDPLAPKPPHFAPKAKRVIYLHMAGSPPQQDLFDYKPQLNAYHGKQAPESFYKGKRLAFIKGVPTLLGCPFGFEQVGPSGLHVSELLPHFKQIAGDVCVIRSMYTEQFNHAPAQLFLQTGFAQPGRPCMGSWLTYGLGSENPDLPAFIVLVSGGKKPAAGSSAWSSGFVPTVHAGVQCRNEGAPVLFLEDPAGMDRGSRRRTIDAINRLNALEAGASCDPETRTRIEQYELAYRMQASVPGVMDITRESPAVLAEYGAEPGKASFANNCLLARRLSESGVRFVQLYDWGWDLHGNTRTNDLLHGLPTKCRETDQPIAALIKDLKRRGMLDDTLVIWSGEFGRTPMNEARDGSKYLGRDHHPGCFTVWMAGGGVKPGMVYGETDELSYSVVDKPVHVHDFQATVLHLLGLDHERLTFRFQGRDFRLTDVHGHVVHDVIA